MTSLAANAEDRGVRNVDNLVLSRVEIGTGPIMRVHGPFVSDEEVEAIADYLRSLGAPQYVDGITDTPDPEAALKAAEVLDDDELYDRAVALVRSEHKASTSYLQRRLSIGYNRAADIIERMEADGLVGPANAAGKRELLMISAAVAEGRGPEGAKDRLVAQPQRETRRKLEEVARRIQQEQPLRHHRSAAESRPI